MGTDRSLRRPCKKGELGIIYRPHGIRGGMILLPSGELAQEDLKETLKGETSVLAVSRDSRPQKMVLEKVVFGHKIIIYFKNISNRTDLEELLPLKLYRGSEGKISPREFPAGLVGLKVYSHKEGKEVGEVVAVGNNTVQKVLEIERGEERFSVPLIPLFVKNIDKEKKRVVVSIPEFV